MLKRLTSLLLCLILASSVLFGCGSENGTGGNGNGGGGSETTSKKSDSPTLYTEEEQAAIDKTVSDRITDLKDGNNGYDGATFTMVGINSNAFPTAEEITGDRESDCIYERNTKVAEDFNIVYDYIPTETGVIAGEKVMQDRDAGLNDISLAYGSLVTIGKPLFNGGYLTQISEYDQIDITNPWWLGTMEQFYSLDGKLMFMSGDILPGFFDTASCMIYNKTVAENYGIEEDFYGDVRDGSWTIDKLFEIASAIPGGGDVKRYGDLYYDVGIAIMMGAGEMITKFDENGDIYVAEDLPAVIDELANKFNAQTGDSAYCYNTIASYDDDVEGETVQKAFVDNKLLFMFVRTENIAALRAENVEAFGILPMPKYNSEQEKYVTYSTTGGQGSIYLPRNPKNADMVGTVVEAMGAYSYQMVRPVYYDLRLKTQSVYDVASREMLDIIYETQVYDLFELYGDNEWATAGKLYLLLTSGIYTDGSTLTSSYKSEAKTIKLMIKTCNRTVDKYYN